MSTIQNKTKAYIQPTVSMEDLSKAAAKNAKEMLKNGSTSNPDFLAEVVKLKFREARTSRSNTRVGRWSLEELLNLAEEQYHSLVPNMGSGETEFENAVYMTPEGAVEKRDMYSSQERNQIDTLMGINIKVSLTKDKVDVAVAALRDLLLSQQDMPFEITGTPIPELPEVFKEQLRREIMQKVMVETELDPNKPEEHLFFIAEQEKDKLLQQTRDVANTVAENHENLAHDQLTEGGFREEFNDFIFNFVLYPYAVFTGPIIEFKPRVKWKGDKLVSEVDAQYRFESVHPRNYYWSPDTLEAGTGEYDIITSSISRHELMQALTSSDKGWIKESINYILAKSTENSGHAYMDWSTDMAVGHDRQPNRFDNTNRATLLKFYGAFLGQDLKRVCAYKFDDVEPEEYYECEAWVAAGRTIWIGQSSNTVSSRRPIFTGTFQRVQKGIGGYGIAAILEDIEREFTLTTRAMLNNLMFLAGPVGEVETNSLDGNFASEDLGRLEPNSLISVKPRFAGNNSSVIRLQQIQNNVPTFINVQENLRHLADIRTGLPPNMHGLTQGSADRTWRGSAARYAQAMKLLQSAIISLEHHVIEPMATELYQLNTLNADDFKEYGELRGDCTPRARGAAGLVEKEVKKTEALEALQVISQVIPALQQSPNYNVQKLLSDVVLEVLRTMGMDTHKYEYSKEELDQIQQAAVQQQMMAQQQQQTAQTQGNPEPSQGGAPVQGIPPVM